MDTTLLFLHILGAGTWLGANLTQVVVTPYMRKRGGEAAAWWTRAVVAMGNRLYAPATVIILITGIWMVLRNDFYEFEQAFVTIGFIAVFIGIFLGIRVFGPKGKALADLYESGGDEGVIAAAHSRLFGLGVFDTLVVIFTIWAMVDRLGA